MDPEPDDTPRDVVYDSTHFNEAFLRKIITAIRIQCSVGPGERATRDKMEWTHGVDTSEEDLANLPDAILSEIPEARLVGITEDRFFALFRYFLAGKTSSGDPRQPFYNELCKTTTDALDLTPTQFPEVIRRNIIKVARMYIMIFLMYHDDREHLLSKLNQEWYSGGFIPNLHTLFQTHPDVLHYHALQYLDKVVNEKKHKLLRMMLVEYIVLLGRWHIDRVLERATFIQCPMRMGVICECIHEYYHGSTVNQFWNALPRCQCCCKTLTLEMMNAAKSERYGMALSLYTRVVMITYLSQVHGIPFIDFLPNRASFMIGRFVTSWSEGLVHSMEKHCNDQIGVICESYRSSTDNLGKFGASFISRQRMVSGFLSPPPHHCLFCVDGIKCALCRA